MAQIYVMFPAWIAPLPSLGRPSMQGEVVAGRAGSIGFSADIQRG